jgi:hypothetical protein
MLVVVVLALLGAPAWARPEPLTEEIIIQHTASLSRPEDFLVRQIRRRGLAFSTLEPERELRMMAAAVTPGTLDAIAEELDVRRTYADVPARSLIDARRCVRSASGVTFLMLRLEGQIDESRRANFQAHLRTRIDMAMRDHLDGLDDRSRDEVRVVLCLEVGVLQHDAAIPILAYSGASAVIWGQMAEEGTGDDRVIRAAVFLALPPDDPVELLSGGGESSSIAQFAFLDGNVPPAYLASVSMLVGRWLGTRGRTAEAHHFYRQAAHDAEQQDALRPLARILQQVLDRHSGGAIDLPPLGGP